MLTTGLHCNISVAALFDYHGVFTRAQVHVVLVFVRRGNVSTRARR